MPSATKQQVAEALEKSIAHWNENVKAKSFAEASVGAHTCALCGLFNPCFGGTFARKLNSCQPCPVAKRAGDSFCRGTPYKNADRTRADWYFGGSREKFRKAARNMRDFLKTLREPN